MTGLDRDQELVRPPPAPPTRSRPATQGYRKSWQALRGLKASEVSAKNAAKIIVLVARSGARFRAVRVRCCSHQGGESDDAVTASGYRSFAVLALAAGCAAVMCGGTIAGPVRRLRLLPKTFSAESASRGE